MFMNNINTANLLDDCTPQIDLQIQHNTYKILEDVLTEIDKLNLKFILKCRYPE